jgi:hypothetical protein
MVRETQTKVVTRSDAGFKSRVSRRRRSTATSPITDAPCSLSPMLPAGEWPERARKLTSDAASDENSMPLTFLADIRDAFVETKRQHSVHELPARGVAEPTHTVVGS